MTVRKILIVKGISAGPRHCETCGEQCEENVKCRVLNKRLKKDAEGCNLREPQCLLAETINISVDEVLRHDLNLKPTRGDDNEQG